MNIGPHEEEVYIEPLPSDVPEALPAAEPVEEPVPS